MINAIADYVRRMGEPVARLGQCEHEDGSESWELWRVEREAASIHSAPASWETSGGRKKGWVDMVLVKERISAGDTGWGEVKLHLIYTCKDAIDHVAIVDLSEIRHSYEDADSAAGILGGLGILQVIGHMA